MLTPFKNTICMKSNLFWNELVDNICIKMMLGRNLKNSKVRTLQNADIKNQDSGSVELAGTYFLFGVSGPMIPTTSSSQGPQLQATQGAQFSSVQGTSLSANPVFAPQTSEPTNATKTNSTEAAPAT